MEPIRQTLHLVAIKFRAWVANLGGKPAVHLLLLLWTRLQLFVRLKNFLTQSRQHADISRTTNAAGSCLTETIFPSRPPVASCPPSSWKAVRRGGSIPDTPSYPAHQEAPVSLHGNAPDTLHNTAQSPSNSAGAEFVHRTESPSMQSREQHVNPVTNDYLREMGIYPIDTTDVLRYERRPPTKSLHVPMGWDVPSNATWVPYTHPEGALYFHDVRLNYVTDANIFDPTICERVERCRAHIEYAKRLVQAEFPANAEIAIEIPPPEDYEYAQGYYYCVEPAQRTVFWLGTKPAGPTLRETKSASLNEIKNELEYHYWKHWELFPLEREIPQWLLQEVIGKLVHAGLDRLTSKTSLAPYSEDQCSSLLNFLEKTNYVQSIHGYSAVAIARVMADFAHTKFVHFHGLPGARLDRTRYLLPDSQPSMLITLISPILFFAPDKYSHYFEKVKADIITKSDTPKEHDTMVQEDWDKYILPATVLLSANFALLAIPAVDQSGGQSNSQTAAQIASYLSSATSTAAIIVGLLLDRNVRLNSHYEFEGMVYHLIRQKNQRYRLELLAILYCLPFSLLMWGMVTFLAACSALFFQNTSITTRLLTGTFWLFSCTAIAWCVLSNWDSSHSWTNQFRQAWSSSMGYRWISLLLAWRRKGPVRRPGESNPTGAGAISRNASPTGLGTAQA